MRTRSRLMRLAVTFAMQPDANRSRAFAMSYVGVRTARYSYVEYRRASLSTRGEGIHAPLGAGRTTDAELYDLQLDPYELENRAKTPRYRQIRAELSALTQSLEGCVGADCLTVAAPPEPGRSPRTR